MIEQLIARALQARNVAHREHWKTRIEASHEALNTFYDDVIDAIDAVVEVHQGRYGLVDFPEIVDKKVDDVSKYLNGEAMWIEANRDKFSDCPAVLNLIDELTAVYLRATYRLTYLS